MPATIRLRRAGYRLAYRLLTVWWFVRRPALNGVKCLLTSGQDVLLVRHTYGPAVWDLPGGAVKRGELPRRAAEREMAEELGISHVQWHEAGVVRGRQSFRRDTIHCFRAEVDHTTVTRNPVELAEIRWFAVSAPPRQLSRYAAALLGE